MGDLDILVVEDNDDHAELLLDSLAEFSPQSKVSRLPCGESVLDLLGGMVDCSECPLPDFVLLDIKLPKCDGIEVLKRLRHHQCWQDVPVFMLTTSTLERDIKSCYRNGANGCFGKPFTYDDFSKVVNTLKER